MSIDVGSLKTLGSLEKALFKQFRITVVFRLSTRFRVYDRLGVASSLNRRLKIDMTVGEWREVLVNVLTDSVAKRGEDYIPKLDVTDIAFISPRGVSVHGNTLLKSIQFPSN